MTVKELIEVLEKMPQEAEVQMVDGELGRMPVLTVENLKSIVVLDLE